MSPNTAPATKSDKPRSPNIAPATKSDNAIKHETSFRLSNHEIAKHNTTTVTKRDSKTYQTSNTELWLDRTITLLKYCLMNYSLAELLLDGTITWLNGYFTELLLD